MDSPAAELPAAEPPAADHPERAGTGAGRTSEQRDHAVTWRVLGPVEVVVHGRVLLDRRPQQRALLAYLLLNSEHVVTIDQIVRALWGVRPPQTARTQIHAGVSRIRRTLREHGVDNVLLGGVGGYRLAVECGAFDLAEFLRRVEFARSAAGRGELHGAVEHYRNALSLWRGAALSGASGAFVEAAAVRLEEKRLQAWEELAGVELTLGHHTTVADELHALVEAYPLRERLVACLMTALAASGRQAEALSLYARTRARLAEELGVEPARELTEVHMRVLRQQVPVSPPASAPHRTPPPRAPVEATPPEETPVAAGTSLPDGVIPAGAASAAPGCATPGAPVSPASIGVTVTPAQLPPDLPAFAGRAEPLRRLDALLEVDPADRVRAVVVTGMPGVGKTALAVRWAHRNAHRFPDGQLYTDLRGSRPGLAPLNPGEALGEALAALGVPPSQQPSGLDARAGLYRSLLAGRRVLVVLDDARDAEQVRPLLPATPGCLAVITSRQQLTGLVVTDAALPVVVEPLGAEEAWQLLAHRLGTDRLAPQGPAVDTLVATSAGLPLALSIAAARAATGPSSLADLVAEMSVAPNILDVFADPDPRTDLRTAFSGSYLALKPPVARLFRVFGRLGRERVDLATVARAARLPASRARLLLAELTLANLIGEPVPDQFTVHPLLLAYAGELAGGSGGVGRAGR